MPARIPTPPSPSRQPGRILLGLLFVAAGTLHFVWTPRYAAIVPRYLPAHRALVLISGAAEIAGGLALLTPARLTSAQLAPAARLRRLAAWGLLALLLAVWPTNFEMALHPARFPSIPPWLLYARLPLQLPLLFWTWLYTRPAPARPKPARRAA